MVEMLALIVEPGGIGVNLLISCEMRMIQLAVYGVELVVVRCLLNVF